MPSEEGRPDPSEFLTDIALVISDLRGGGAQRVAVTMANAWLAAGLRVAVITQSSPDMRQPPHLPGRAAAALQPG